MKKLIYAFITFGIVALFILSQYLINLWPYLYNNRYSVVSLFGLRDYLKFINVIIDNTLVALGGGLKYLCVHNSDLIAVYFLIVIICVFLSKRLKLQLNRKRLVLFNSALILIYIAYIVLTRNWLLINILMLVLFLFTHGLVWLPRLITKKNSATVYIGQGIIFCCISILLIVLTGNNSEKADLISECGYYDIKISQNLRKVFYENEYYETSELCPHQPERFETIEVLDMDNLKHDRIPYKGSLGQYISIDEDRGNLYFTDRGNKKLVIMDLNDYSIKGEVHHPIIEYGDGFIEYDKDHIYFLSEEHLMIIKIDINTLERVKMNIIDYDAEGAFMSIDNNGTLYVSNHIDYKNNLFFIWVINPFTLKIVKKVPVDGPIARMIFLKRKDILYHSMFKGPLLTAYVSVRDSKSLKIKDKIIVPFGLRDIAIDEERGLLFAGNALTGIVEVIDLSNKKIVKLIKTSNSMLRRLALDTVNQYVYITTWVGLYRYSYK